MLFGMRLLCCLDMYNRCNTAGFGDRHIRAKLPAGGADNVPSIDPAFKSTDLSRAPVMEMQYLAVTV